MKPRNCAKRVYNLTQNGAHQKWCQNYGKQSLGAIILCCKARSGQLRVFWEPPKAAPRCFQVPCPSKYRSLFSTLVLFGALLIDIGSMTSSLCNSGNHQKLVQDASDCLALANIEAFSVLWYYLRRSGSILDPLQVPYATTFATTTQIFNNLQPAFQNANCFRISWRSSDHPAHVLCLKRAKLH